MNYGPYVCAGFGTLCGLLGLPNEIGIHMTVGGLLALLFHYIASMVMP